MTAQNPNLSCFTNFKRREDNSVMTTKLSTTTRTAKLSTITRTACRPAWQYLYTSALNTGANCSRVTKVSQLHHVTLYSKSSTSYLGILKSCEGLAIFMYFSVLAFSWRSSISLRFILVFSVAFSPPARIVIIYASRSSTSSSFFATVTEGGSKKTTLNSSNVFFDC